MLRNNMFLTLLILVLVFPTISNASVAVEAPDYVEVPDFSTLNDVRITWPEPEDATNVTRYALFESRNFGPYNLVQFTAARAYTARGLPPGKHLYVVSACSTSRCAEELSEVSQIEIDTCHTFSDVEATFRNIVTSGSVCFRVPSRPELGQEGLIVHGSNVRSDNTFLSVFKGPPDVGVIGGANFPQGSNGLDSEVNFVSFHEGDLRLVLSASDSTKPYFLTFAYDPLGHSFSFIRY